MQDCKYKKEQKIVSYNGGEDWQNVMPEEFRKGDLIEADSPDCAVIETMYRWRVLDGIFICEDKVKYESEIMDESYDGGSTWYPSYPTQYRKGSEVGYDADYCGYKGKGHYDVEPTKSSECPKGQFWDGRKCYHMVSSFDPMKNTKCSDENSVITTADTRYRTISGYTASLRAYSIGSCTTEIGYGAFSGQTSLTSCTFEADSQLTTIANNAFRGCSGLTSIDIPSGVTSIGNSAFTSCYSLTSVTIPSGVTNINDYVFSECNRISSVTIPDSVRMIGVSSFAGCSSLTSVTIPSGVTSIGNGAFWGCGNIENVTVNAVIPPTLGSNVFGGIYRPYSIYVPCSSMDLYVTASSWSDYASKILPIPPCEIVYKIITTASTGEILYMDCNSSSVLTKAEVDEVKDSYYSFSAVIGTCVTEIESSAFTSSRLTSIDIPDSVTTIGNRVFYSSTRLTSIDIPSGVTSIGYSAFTYCTGLTGVTVEATTPPTLGNDAFKRTNDCPIYVPCESLNTYKSASGWSTYTSRIQALPCPPKWVATYSDSHTESAECADSSVILWNEITRTNLVSVQIGSCVWGLNGESFYAATGLTSVTIPNSVTSIGNEVFSNCISLTTIDIPNSVIQINKEAFYYCIGLTSVIIGTGITTIGSAVFMDCSSLTSVIIYAITPPTLGSSVFDGSSCQIYVPSGSVNTYKAASGWSTYASRIQPIT